MSRMRQIPIMDVRQQERMLQQNQSAKTNTGSAHTPIYHPPVYNSARPVPTGCKPRGRRQPVTKFRLCDTPALISTGCSSVREFCNSVQSITVDLNNLIGSVESMVPLLNMYLTAIQNRSASIESEEAPIEVNANDYRMQTQSETTTEVGKASQRFHQASTSQNTTTKTTPIPRPEDIQALLENPLVHSLLNGFMQNSAFPNASVTKENTLHS